MTKKGIASVIQRRSPMTEATTQKVLTRKLPRAGRDEAVVNGLPTVLTQL